MGRGHTFLDKKTKEEMLDLRRKGYTYFEIARKYNSTHTTIVYHCKRAGLFLKKEDKEAICTLVKKGFSATDIGLKLNVPSTMVDFYCFKNGIRGKRLIYRTKLDLEPISVKPPRKKRELRLLKPKGDFTQLFKVDERGVEWVKDERDKWICLGKSEKQQYIDDINRKKEILKIKQLKMITY